ncbi:MAG: RNA methyltransferase, partial [Rhodospirillaceae bacterium]|nr:RNA methyltransferase [Rhodospirillaceae bacterium]
MAGTDKSQLEEDESTPETPSLAVILVEPQMGENIG